MNDVETTRTKTPRVWLVGGNRTPDPAPGDQPTVRDDLMHRWHPSPAGDYATPDGRHHATWSELRARHDLVEITTTEPEFALSTSDRKAA